MNWAPSLTPSFPTSSWMTRHSQWRAMSSNNCRAPILVNLQSQFSMGRPSATLQQEIRLMNCCKGQICATGIGLFLSLGCRSAKSVINSLTLYRILFIRLRDLLLGSTHFMGPSLSHGPTSATKSTMAF